MLLGGLASSAWCARGSSLSAHAHGRTIAPVRLLWHSRAALSAHSASASATSSSSSASGLPISQYWQQRLKDLVKPAAVSLIPALSHANALCFENKKTDPGSLVSFVALEKEKRPDQLLLIRVGEFYEAYGLDALMLVEHAGLNPMGRKARAGCPISNIQATLDDLASLHFLDGGHRLPDEAAEKMPERLRQIFPPPYFEWWNAREEPDGAVAYAGVGRGSARAPVF